MKIVVIEFAGRGGMIHYAWQLCDALSELGAEVTLITDRDHELESLPRSFRLHPLLRLWDPKPDDDVPKLMRRVRRGWRAVRYYREWLRLAVEIRKLKPDVVHFGDIRFASDLAPLLMIRRIAPVMADVCHNVQPFSGGASSTGTFSMSSAEHALYRRIYACFDAIFVHYEENVRAFGESFPSHSGKVTRIVHGNQELFRQLADADISVARLREQLELEESSKVILFFGTLTGYKGIHLLLHAFAEVSASAPEAVLVVAGYPLADFDTHAWLEEADALGVREKVRLVARYAENSEIAPLMELASAAAFPYRAIFQSGALQVALTFGVPVVATKVGAMPEVIRDRETGLLVDAGDVGQLADALLWIIRNPDAAAQMGAAAARDSQQRFSWSDVAKTMLERYGKLLAERRRR